MKESWINTDEKTIRDDIVEIAKEKTGLSNFKSTGILRGFLEVIAAVVFFIYKTAINAIYNNATLDGATGVFLTFWGLMLGVVRKQESKASGKFTGRSYGEGSVPSGAWIVVEGTELRYKVTAKVDFDADAEFQIPVIAEFAGSDYNIGREMPLRCTRVIPGLDSLAVGDDWIENPGAESESDDSYRDRIKSKWKGQVLGDTKEVYTFYAEEVSGVREARIVRAPRGPGSTDVIIASVNGVPSEELLEAVRNNLHGHELMAFDVQVKAPIVKNIEIVIEYTGEADEADVALIAESYVRNLQIGGRFRITDLYERFKTLTLTTIEILSPDRDVESGDDAIIEADIEVSRSMI